jgi:hypothetical protein
MNPPGADRSQGDEVISIKTADRMQSLCDGIYSEFKKGPAKLLLRYLDSDKVKKERAKSLRDILMEAARIATSLWVQRPYLDVVGLDTIMARRMAFNVQSPIMQSHPLNKVDVDDQTGRHNSRRILLVVRPALLAFEEDDTQGLDGEGYRVLANAIVFLED